MATATISHDFLVFINSKRFLSIVSLLVICMSLRNCYAFEFEGRKMVENDYTHHVFDVTSLFSTSCQSSVQGTSRPASMKITHSHGHCSKPSNTKNVPTLAENLTRDQSRVASIQNRNAFKADLENIRTSKSTIPAKSGSALGTGNYVVSVGLGSPAKYVTLVFDTGSSLTWTQCQPCVKFCYTQSDPIFDPSASATYGNISCTSAQCYELSSATGNTPSCSSTTCIYGIQYGDQSFSVGFLGKERLTLTANDVFDNFLFGCGENNRGLFGNSAGLLGLGRDSLSVVTQTAQKYGKYFSYCLPTKSGSNGHLSFGKYGAPRNLAFTPFASSSSQASSFYFVSIVAISVGGKQLPISSSVFQSGGTIVDSGTVITRLPPTAYTALRDSFKQQMSRYPLAPGLSILDTCYDFSNYTTATIPRIAFIFAGNANVVLGATGILVAASQSQVCLAFAPNSDDTDTGIYGNVQQQTFEVAYDVAGGRLGFAPNGCR